MWGVAGPRPSTAITRSASSSLTRALLTEAAPVHPDVVAFTQAAERYHRECVDALNDGDLTGYRAVGIDIEVACSRGFASRRLLRNAPRG